MTVRNKALGRAKGPFAATQYIRGDVINFQGALYAAKESFTATSTFNLNDWDEVLAAPASAFVKATIGPGLPSLADRANGDLHYDTQARKLFAHIGAAGGVLLSDNFNRADGPLNGTTTTTGNVVWEGFGAIITGNRMRFSSGSSYSGFVALDTGGYNNDLSTNVTFTTQSDGSYGGTVEIGLESKGDQGMGSITAPYKLKFYLPNGATSCTFSVYGPSGKVKADGTLATGTPQQIEDYRTGTVTGISAARPITIPVRFSIDVNGRLRAWINNNLVFDAIVEIALPQNKGTHVMLTGSSYYFDGVYYDDLLAGALGTLEWAESKIDAANINFTPIGNLAATDVKAALNELDMEKAPLVHVHTGRGGDSAVNTVEAGLPSLLGRANGDLHLDTTVGRAFVRSGALGVTKSDTFTRANAALYNNTAAQTFSDGSGTLWLLNGDQGAFSISNNRLVGADWPGGASVARPAGGFIVGADFVSGAGHLALDDAAISSVLTSWAIQATDSGWSVLRENTTFTPSTGSRTGSTAGAKAVALEVSGNTIRWYINGVLEGTYTEIQATVDAISHVGFVITGGSVAWDNFSLVSIGTAAWTPAEPIYLQAHLVSGNVAVANHVLKPGIRVPTASVLKEVVLRCETAPVGASLTVAIERFNGGVSQGIIATASIPTGENVGSVVGLSAACAKGDILKFNVTSVGSTTAGADLTASLELR